MSFSCGIAIASSNQELDRWEWLVARGFVEQLVVPIGRHGAGVRVSRIGTRAKTQQLDDLGPALEEVALVAPPTLNFQTWRSTLGGVDVFVPGHRVWYRMDSREREIRVGGLLHLLDLECRGRLEVELLALAEVALHHHFPIEVRPSSSSWTPPAPHSRDEEFHAMFAAATKSRARFDVGDRETLQQLIGAPLTVGAGPVQFMVTRHGHGFGTRHQVSVSAGPTDLVKDIILMKQSVDLIARYDACVSKLASQLDRVRGLRSDGEPLATEILAIESHIIANPIALETGDVDVARLWTEVPYLEGALFWYRHEIAALEDAQRTVHHTGV